MLKLYKWLGTCNVRPYKKYGHFRNCLAILFSRNNIYAEKKIKNKRKEGNQPTYPRHRPQLTLPRPKPTSDPCRLPRRGKHLAGRHAYTGGSYLPAWRPPRPSSRSRKMPATS